MGQASTGFVNSGGTSLKVVASESDRSVREVSLRHGWHATIYRNWSLPEEVLRDWTQLARAYGDRGLFLLPGWFRTWWSAFGVGELAIIALSADGRTQAIAPCWIGKGKGDRRALMSLNNEVFWDFLIRSEDSSAALNAFSELLKILNMRMELHVLSNTTGHRPGIEKMLRESGFPFWKYEEPYAPYVRVNCGTWDEYEARLHPKLRNNIQKGRRRAAKEGTLEFEVVSSSENLEKILKDVFQVEASGWKGDGKTAILFSDAKMAWYRGIADWAAKQGCLRIFLLRLNGRIIAFDLDFAFGNTVFALKTGYDNPSASRFSAGNIMRFELLKSLWQDPSVQCYDFLGDFYPWKVEWTGISSGSTALFVYPATILGRLEYLLRHGWKQPLKRSRGVMALISRMRKLRKHDAGHD